GLLFFFLFYFLLNVCLLLLIGMRHKKKNLSPLSVTKKKKSIGRLKLELLAPQSKYFLFVFFYLKNEKLSKFKTIWKVFIFLFGKVWEKGHKWEKDYEKILKKKNNNWKKEKMKKKKKKIKRKRKKKYKKECKNLKKRKRKKNDVADEGN
ncbi:hypothetical protein RFI_22629, partial [Reticulomyxa filosa]